MSKHNWKNREAREEGADVPAEQEEQSAMPEVESTEPQEGAEIQPEAEPNEQSAEPEVQQETPKAAMGIGQFVRYLLTKSNKSNAEVLELVLKTFEGAKTTAACIAWYKSDLRKKGVLPKGEGRSATKMVEITAEELENMVK